MSDEKKAVCLKLENVSKVFAKVESDLVTNGLECIKRYLLRWQNGADSNA